MAVFTIQDIDPQTYRTKTRNSTLIIMGIFLVIGMISATTTVELLSPYNSNHIVLNLLGAFIGLVITFFFVKTFFISQPWMKEAMYGWQLKRSLMHITNVIDKLKTDVAINDHQAMKTLQFYYLGLEQMHRLENNHPALIDIKAEKAIHEQKLQAAGIALNQNTFEPKQVERYKSTQAHDLQN